MRIIKTFDYIAAEEYFEVIPQLYGKNEAVKKYIADSRKGFEKVISSEQIDLILFQAMDNNKFTGQIALIYSQSHEAFFGFFECLDLNIIKDLWHELIKECNNRNIKKLFGPVNGTIWYPYRFISKDSEEQYFPSEPVAKIEYNEVFKSFNPVHTIEYHSAYRTDFTSIIEATRGSYNELKINNIEISLQKPSIDLMRDIFELAIKVFSANPGYSHISFDDFYALYKERSSDNNRNSIYLAKADNSLVGFCLTPKYENTLLMKTIAVLPEWQQKGIGNALVHKIHSDAYDEKISKVIYALVRKDNQVKHFPMDKVTVFREYSAHLFLL